MGTSTLRRRATLRMRHLVLVDILLYLWISHVSCQALPLNGVKVVTYGEPCHAPSYLPVRIEEPVALAKGNVPSQIYQPLKLNYQTSQPLPEPEQHRQHAYPFFVEVPEVKQPQITASVPYQTKSYGYNVYVPPSKPEPALGNYNFDLHVLPPTPTVEASQKPIKLLTGLTTRIDRILVPACEVTNSS